MYDSSFRGLGVALVTPFDLQGNIDFKKLADIADNLASEADYIVVLGTTAETPALTDAEKIKVRDVVARTVAGRVPLVLGFGSNCTAALCQSLKQWDGKDYEAILSVVPFYNKPGQCGIYRHFKAVAEASPRPVILYNVPGRTGVNMQSATTLRLANEVKGIVGIKEASGNLTQVEEIIASAPKSFSLISGDDGLTTEIVARGGQGVISVIANAAPKVWRHLTHLALDGKIAQAQEMQKRLLPLEKMLFEQGNPSGIKGLLSVMGICDNSLRLPMTPVSDDLLARMRAFVAEYPNLC